MNKNKLLRVKTLDHLFNYSPQIKSQVVEDSLSTKKFRVFTFSDKLPYQENIGKISTPKLMVSLQSNKSFQSLTKLEKAIHFHNRKNSFQHHTHLNQLLHDDQYQKIISIKMEDVDPFFKKASPLKQEIKPNEQKQKNNLLRKLQVQKQLRDDEFQHQNQEKIRLLNQQINHSPGSRYYKTYIHKHGYRQPEFLNDVEIIQ
ncbi:unnamed protein product (macronuclear) [Paramecium tetraurelia]|uniref:Uncharacterized protein n=1 Tax=Paramecium tetraurelia TaxID=5888 RepID=A0BN68_PARTE|nr:uncharacterized protein GSPATT00030623001 [Paramecium tetraurelia]CAK59985.1 unnamed protein product [Paramecium tetraurelia]|eukprot:XP_001427383.1 hypothetical protein (macronuclear) [Paramecium tetraurelia strain d4-2]